MQIIGTSHQVINSYQHDARENFIKLAKLLESTTIQLYNITYEGPDADEFNLAILNLINQLHQLISEQVIKFMEILKQVTENISRSLGAPGFELPATLIALDTPPLPGIVADDFKVDISQFDQLLNSNLPHTQIEAKSIISLNETRFHEIPYATTDSKGWSGQSRDYAQAVILPAQTEQFHYAIDRVFGEIINFLESTKSRIMSADAI